MERERRYWILLDYLVNQQRTASQIVYLSADSTYLLGSFNRVLAVVLDGSLTDLSEQVSGLISRVPGGNFDIIIIGDNDSALAAREAVPEVFNGSAYLLGEDGLVELVGGEKNRKLKNMLEGFTKDADTSINTEFIKTRLITHLNQDRKTARDIASFQERFSILGYRTTIALAVLIAAVFLLEEFWGGSSFLSTLVRMGANTGKDEIAREPWRLVTSVFLHGGFLHVFANTYVLVALGSFVNRIFGESKFLFLFMVAGIAGSLASAFAGRALVSVGASGALWGLFGVSAALSIMRSEYLPEAIRLRFRRATIINIGINLPVSFLPMVDLWAHLGGGFAGFLVGLAFIKSRRNDAFESTVKILYPILWGVIVICITIGWYYGKPWELTRASAIQHHSVDGITVSMPAFLKQLNTREQPGIVSAEFGDLPNDPLKVVVQVIPLEQPLYGDTRVQNFEKIKKDYLVNTPGLKRIGTPAETVTPEFMMLTDSVRTDQHLLIQRTVQVRVKHIVKLEIATLDSEPEAVTRMATNIIGSIREN